MAADTSYIHVDSKNGFGRTTTFANRYTIHKNGAEKQSGTFGQSNDQEKTLSQQCYRTATIHHEGIHEQGVQLHEKEEEEDEKEDIA